MISNLSKRVRDEIAEELEPVLAAGFSVDASEYSGTGFGNFYVELLRGAEKLRIIRDRGQYMVQGDEAELKRFGLCRAFDSKADFFAVLSRYVGTAK